MSAIAAVIVVVVFVRTFSRIYPWNMRNSSTLSAVALMVENAKYYCAVAAITPVADFRLFCGLSVYQ